MAKPTSIENFWEKVARSDECWLWAGSQKPNGYGSLTYRGHTFSAHRFAYELAYGPIPEGVHVLHRCDVKHCVRHDHLFLGSHDDNMKDKKSKDRGSKGEAHGRHKLTENEVRQIRQLYGTDGETFSSLGRRFGVSHITVRNIIHGKVWAWLK